MVKYKVYCIYVGTYSLAKAPPNTTCPPYVPTYLLTHPIQPPLYLPNRPLKIMPRPQHIPHNTENHNRAINHHTPIEILRPRMIIHWPKRPKQQEPRIHARERIIDRTERLWDPPGAPDELVVEVDVGAGDIGVQGAGAAAVEEEGAGEEVGGVEGGEEEGEEGGEDGGGAEDDEGDEDGEHHGGEDRVDGKRVFV